MKNVTLFFRTAPNLSACPMRLSVPDGIVKSIKHVHMKILGCMNNEEGTNPLIHEI